MGGKLKHANPVTPKILYTTKNKLAFQKGHLKYLKQKKAHGVGGAGRSHSINNRI